MARDRAAVRVIGGQMRKIVTGAAVVFSLPVFLIFALLIMLAGAGGGSGSLSLTGPGGGLTKDAPIPEKYRALIEKAMKPGCPQVTPSLLAAQLYTESAFNPKAQSPADARGIAQFIPATWAAHGVDGNGDGVRDIWNPEDAIPSAASYDCAVADEVKRVPGNASENMLAAYNAGSGAVLRYGGVPPYEETRGYVKEIRDLAAKWGTANGGLIPVGSKSGSGGARRAIAAAMTAMNTPYQWGGSCEAPYTGGQGCDCSSLTQMAWGAAGVNLPRTTYEQVEVGTPVSSIDQLSPGDLLFSVGSATAPEHVGMYIGNGEVIEAPRSGLDVRIKPISWWKDQVVAMRRIG
ncbi:bifunctional lytic transglycosylase/C40 family peptidase [Streptomyces syringium]|uniref:C40 family peptidase n=1 Tax=Streptomyces syringium TaxID=76729 RepID=UPI00341A92C0